MQILKKLNLEFMSKIKKKLTQRYGNIFRKAQNKGRLNNFVLDIKV